MGEEWWPAAGLQYRITVQCPVMIWFVGEAAGPCPCPLSTSPSLGCLRRQQDLFRVLKAYTLYRPEEGYCQAQAPIAAVLLMHMPAEVRARCREGRETQGPESWDQREGAGLFGVVLAGRVLGSWHLFAPKLGWCREVPVAPGALCLLPPAPVVPREQGGSCRDVPRGTPGRSPAVPWLAASVLVPGADLREVPPRLLQ